VTAALDRLAPWIQEPLRAGHADNRHADDAVGRGCSPRPAESFVHAGPPRAAARRERASASAQPNGAAASEQDPRLSPARPSRTTASSTGRRRRCDAPAVRWEALAREQRAEQDGPLSGSAKLLDRGAGVAPRCEEELLAPARHPRSVGSPSAISDRSSRTKRSRSDSCTPRLALGRHRTTFDTLFRAESRTSGEGQDAVRRGSRGRRPSERSRRDGWRVGRPAGAEAPRSPERVQVLDDRAPARGLVHGLAFRKTAGAGARG